MVDGERAPASLRLRGGAQVEFKAPLPERDPHQQAAPVQVLMRDRWMMVVNKPPGQLAHQAGKTMSGTLLNAIQDLLESEGADPARVRLVNRIDRDTSGIVLVSLDEGAHAVMGRAMEARTLRKEYLAVVRGSPTPAHGDWREPIGPAGPHTIAREVRADGQSAHTAYATEALAQDGAYARLRLRLHTGRQHQIRVHAAHHGHALVGDWVYGAPCTELPGQALHSALLAMPHPITGAELLIEAPLPAAVAALWERLCAHGAPTPVALSASQRSKLGLVDAQGPRRPSWLSADEFQRLRAEAGGGGEAARGGQARCDHRRAAAQDRGLEGMRTRRRRATDLDAGRAPRFKTTAAGSRSRPRRPWRSAAARPQPPPAPGPGPPARSPGPRPGGGCRASARGRRAGGAARARPGRGRSPRAAGPRAGTAPAPPRGWPGRVRALNRARGRAWVHGVATTPRSKPPEPRRAQRGVGAGRSSPYANRTRIVTVLFFLLAALGFGFVIIIHELGHYTFAKWAGVRVDTFAVGFGKTILSRRWGETTYCLNLLPFGGFVKMLGQEDVPGEQPKGVELDPRSFLAKPAYWRALIMFGGVLFNFVSSFLILLALAYHGMPYSRPQVGEVIPVMQDATGTRVDSPAYRLGLRQGDWIESIDGERVRTFEDLLPVELLRTRTPLTVVVERRGVDHPITLPDHDGKILPVFSRATGTPSLGIEQPLSNRIGVLGLYGPEPGHPELGERVVGFSGAGGEDLDLEGTHGPPLCGQEIGALLAPWCGRMVSLELEKDGVRRSARIRYAGTFTGTSEDAETGFPTVVEEIESGSAAEKAGIKPGDCILAVSGAGVGNVEQIIGRIQRELVANGQVALTIARRDSEGRLCRVDIPVAGDRKEGGQLRIGALLRARYSGRLCGLPLLSDGSRLATDGGHAPGQARLRRHHSRHRVRPHPGRLRCPCGPQGGAPGGDGHQRRRERAAAADQAG